MTIDQARAIVDRFNCDLGEYREYIPEPGGGGDTAVVDMASTIDGVVAALATTDYGDGVPTAAELSQIREALETLYIDQGDAGTPIQYTTAYQASRN